MPTPQETAAFVEKVQEDVQSGELDVLTAAMRAVWHGFLMIGTTQSRPVHHPVPITEHRFRDFRDGGTTVFLDDGPPKLLRATGVANLAIASALWGDANSQAEKEARIRSIMGEYSEEAMYFGAGMDADETRRRMQVVPAIISYKDEDGPGELVFPRASDAPRRGRVEAFHFHPREVMAYKVHARPEFINEAIKRPLKGSIDFIADDLVPPEKWPCTEGERALTCAPSAWREFPRQPGSWLIDQPQETVFSLSVTGADLPPCIPRRYEQEPLR